MRRLPWRTGLELGALVVVLVFVGVVQFIPHYDTFRNPSIGDEPGIVELAKVSVRYARGEHEGYPYALHVDEHLHWAWTARIQEEDRIVPGGHNAYVDDPPELNAFGSLRGAVHERGFHLALAQAQELTGVSFYHLFKFLPAAWMAFIAFGIWATLRPNPAALPAAAFVALVPTTVRFMGPGFLVPIGFALAWLPATMILAEPGRRRAGAAALLLLTVGWAFFVHLIAGFAAVGLLLMAAIFGRVEDRRSTLVLLAIALLPVAWLYRAFTGDVQNELNKEESLPIDFTIFDGWGIIALFLWVAGVAFLVSHTPTRRRTETVAFGAFSAAALGLIVGGVVFDLGKYATYARWHPPFFLAASVPLAHATVVLGGKAHEAVTMLSRWIGPARVAAPVVAVLFVAGMVTATASPAIEGHMRERYYHVVDDTDWSRIQHVKDGVGPEYEVFISHPWKAPVIAAETGKRPYSFLMPGAPPVNDAEVREYANNGQTMEWFIMNDITLIVMGGRPPHREFEQRREGVFVMREDIAQEIAKIRAKERAGR